VARDNKDGVTGESGFKGETGEMQPCNVMERRRRRRGNENFVEVGWL
jgi:hypothetical protein